MLDIINQNQTFIFLVPFRTIIIMASQSFFPHMNVIQFHQKKNMYFLLLFAIRFQSQKTFCNLNPFSRLKQVACDKLVANDKGYWMKEKANKYISSFNSIVYVLPYATRMQLFWSQLRANHVLPRVLIFDHLHYCYYYYYFEII